MHEDKFGAARRASGMTCEGAGNICGITRVTYQQRETAPGDFRLAELQSLYREMTQTAKPILFDAIGFFICGSDYVKRNNS